MAHTRGLEVPFLKSFELFFCVGVATRAVCVCKCVYLRHTSLYVTEALAKLARLRLVADAARALQGDQRGLVEKGSLDSVSEARVLHHDLR